MFKKYNFNNFINEAIVSAGFREPTIVQKEVIPKILKNQNLIVTSQTGTGKTHAFLLPVLNKIIKGDTLDILIVVPTRELAYQTKKVVDSILIHFEEDIDVRLYVGGTDRTSEINRLKESQPQIAIGTIGKIKDLSIDQNLLKIHEAKTVIVDEADMVFEDSEVNNLDQVFSKFLDNTQYLIFSATIFNDLVVFLNKYFTKFEFIDLTPKTITHSNIEHIFIPTKNKNKLHILNDLLNSFNPYLVLIFANTKIAVDEVAKYLGENNFKIAKITGDLEARTRRQILNRIKKGEFQFVVASDIASRGIDIEAVSHVINFELPNDLDFFIHRTGRTGRVDYEGVSISFYDFDDDSYLLKLSSKGLLWKTMELKNGELLPVKLRKFEKDEAKTDPEISQVHKSIPIPKKVKPGYRKKRNQMINKEIRKIKRQRIENIYKNKRKSKEQ